MLDESDDRSVGGGVEISWNKIVETLRKGDLDLGWRYGDFFVETRGNHNLFPTNCGNVRLGTRNEM